MKLILWFGALLLLFTVWNRWGGAPVRLPPEDGRPRAWVDVRTPGEFARGHIQGAVNLPYDQIREGHPLLGREPLLPDRTLVLYCRSGRRSAIAARSLEALGYSVVDLGSFGNAKKGFGR